MEFEDQNGEELSRLSRAEVLEASAFSREEAMALVGLYISMQKLRVSASNKVSAHARNVDELADPVLIMKLKAKLHFLEKDAAKGLKKWAETQALGRWAMQIRGVGPVITAGLLAHIDVARAPTAGAVWRFAGLDPTCVWQSGEKRPYNAALKRLCWLLGESFKKVPADADYSDPACLYAKLYRQRKEKEVERNELGENAVAAKQRLADSRGRRVSPEQRKIWGSGKLQAVGVDRRAARYAVKIFLSHFHQVGREILGLPMVKPWAIEHGGHAHYIAPPCWPIEE
jgi:hypothetical protein